MKTLNEKVEDTLDVFNDNLIPDSDEDDSLKDIIEDTDIEIPSIELDESDEFVPVTLSYRFDKYDINGDDFIDDNELISVTGVTENNDLAMGAADSDGDGMLSRDEFDKGPWDFDDDSNETSDSESDGMDDLVDDITDEEIIDFDDDEFNEIIEENEIFDDSTDEIKIDSDEDGLINDNDVIVDGILETELNSQLNEDENNNVEETNKLEIEVKKDDN